MRSLGKPTPSSSSSKSLWAEDSSSTVTSGVLNLTVWAVIVPASVAGALLAVEAVSARRISLEESTCLAIAVAIALFGVALSRSRAWARLALRVVFLMLSVYSTLVLVLVAVLSKSEPALLFGPLMRAEFAPLRYGAWFAAAEDCFLLAWSGALYLVLSSERLNRTIATVSVSPSAG